MKANPMSVVEAGPIPICKGILPIIINKGENIDKIPINVNMIPPTSSNFQGSQAMTAQTKKKGAYERGEKEVSGFLDAATMANTKEITLPNAQMINIPSAVPRNQFFSIPC